MAAPDYLGSSTLPMHMTVDNYNTVCTRILTGHILDTEEVRKDTPTSFINGFEYIGLALDNSLTNTAVWSIVRISYDSRGRQTRIQYRTNMSWDDRTTGWN